MAFLLDDATKSDLLVIDGATLTAERLTDATKKFSETLSRHGTVFIWVSPQNLDNVNKLLPSPITLNQVAASSLFADREAKETASIALADLYFGDQSDLNILKYGMDGALLKQSKVLMESRSFGRRRFANAGEVRSIGLISFETGGGKLLLTSLPPDARSERSVLILSVVFLEIWVLQLLSTSEKFNNGFDGARISQSGFAVGWIPGCTLSKDP